VKSYKNEELQRALAGHDRGREAEKLDEIAAAEDYGY